MSDQIPTPPPASPYVAPAAGPKQGLSLTSCLLGLVGLVIGWIPFVGILGFLAAVAAVILGFIAKAKEKQAPKWMWLVGIIAGFVAIAIGLIVLIAAIVALATLGASVGSLNNY
jgi:hypothetical protein